MRIGEVKCLCQVNLTGAFFSKLSHATGSCDLIFKEEKRKKLHEKKCLAEELPCENCGKVFHSDELLKKYLKIYGKSFML